MRIAAIAALVALMAGCAGPSLTGTGLNMTANELGGKIPNGVSNMPASGNAARAHCAQFGKKAQITQMDAPSQGGMLAFECH